MIPDRAPLWLQKYRQQIKLGLLVLGVALFQQKLIVPLQARNTQLQAESVQIRAEIEATQEALKSAARLTEAAAQDAQLDAELQGLLSYNNNYANLIRSISAESELGDSLRVKKVAVEKQESLADFNRVDLGLEVTGTFLSVGKFLEGLEKSKLLTEVQSIDLKRLPGGELKRCSVKIKLSGYVTKSS